MARTRSYSTPGNLAVELSSFVGRGRELLEIRRLLAVAHAVTLTGAGGIGKSRLALRAAHKLGRHFPDGVWMVELAELDSPELLPYALAQAMRVQERRDDVPIGDALVVHLRDRRLLLVLDNCEHLLEGCRALVSSIVSRSESLRVLCTSRQRLGVPGEAVVAMSALEVPEAAEELSLAGLGEVEALRLLVDRAVAVAPGFALGEENRGAVTEICRRLDGSPLAIELAAVRLSSMTPEDLLERLDDRFRLLAVDGGHNVSRSQTLRATVDWSHGLLGEEERILWRRLSVFAGGCDIEAAEAVCSGAGLERERVVDVIGSLVDRSILTMRHGERRGRYLLLETMRLYGAERLREAGEETELRRRHAAWYAQLVTGGEPVWWESADQADVLDLLDVEWANVESALEFWAESSPDAEPGLAMATNLWLYWDVRGSYRIGRRHLEAFLALVPAPTATRALALCACGSHAQSTGDYDVAFAGFEEARRISTEVGADRELAYALFGLGIAGLRLGKPELALQSLAASRETMLRLDNAMGRALALYFLAMALEGAGQLAEARRLALEGLDASERAGDTYVRGILNTLLGVVEWRLHDVQAAEERLEEAVRTQDGIGHRLGIAESLEGLAWVAASTGRLERASRLLGAADALWEELGNALLPISQPHHDACEATARAGLGEVRYRACWEEGRALGRGREIAAAVEETISREQRAPAAMAEYDAFALSARELEVARLVADGLSNTAIAAALFLSVATIKTHVSHILRKLALDSRVQLASWVAAHDPGDTTLAPR